VRVNRTVFWLCCVARIHQPLPLLPPLLSSSRSLGVMLHDARVLLLTNHRPADPCLPPPLPGEIPAVKSCPNQNLGYSLCRLNHPQKTPSIWHKDKIYCRPKCAPLHRVLLASLYRKSFLKLFCLFLPKCALSIATPS
jgi:hypothetical protein